MNVSAPPRPDVQDDPEALIPEARDRQRRRRAIAAAVLALAAALALAVNAILGGGGFPTTIGNAFGLGGGPPTCRSAQLKTTHRAPGVPAVFNQFARQGIGVTVVANRSRTACSLPAPQVSIFSHGHKLGVRQVDGRALRIGPKAPAVHVLQPGKRAQIDFTWSNWCGSPTLYGTRELKRGPPPTRQCADHQRQAPQTVLRGARLTLDRDGRPAELGHRRAVRGPPSAEVLRIDFR